MRWTFLLMTLLLVSGCHNAVVNEKADRKQAPQPVKKNKSRYAVEHDSAPKGPLPTVFQTIKPVDEPFSRYGNPESYEVDGKKYQVLRTVKGYKERGLASWYGTKFHSQRTSSGDDYDMYAMTAAHKTLPIPCYVRITNLQNGREAVVKVNDRGPFHSERIIDLSYAAATKLGILPQGTAPVEIEALTIKGKEHIAQYYIQAGVFSSKDLANLLQAKLSKITASPVVIENYQQRYIVKVGPFNDRNATNRLKAILASNGVQGAFTMLQ